MTIRNDSYKISQHFSPWHLLFDFPMRFLGSRPWRIPKEFLKTYKDLNKKLSQEKFYILYFKISRKRYSKDQRLSNRVEASEETRNLCVEIYSQNCLQEFTAKRNSLICHYRFRILQMFFFFRCDFTNMIESSKQGFENLLCLEA